MDSIATNPIDANTLRSVQETRFSAVWPHIAATPLYQRKLQNAGIAAGAVESLADLQRLPFLYKDEISQSTVLERTPLATSDIFAIYSSNGTSGPPTLYAWSEEDVQVNLEVARRLQSNVGVTSSDMGLILAPLSLPAMGHCMIRQFQAVGAGFIPLGPSDPAQALELIHSLPVTILATLPVVASRLHGYQLHKLGRPLSESVAIRQLQMGGDFLSRARRRRLEHTWRARCYDFYGISEIFGPLCGECSQQAGLHFAADYVFVEVLDPRTRRPVEDGEPGVAVYTTLWRKGFPLLRYWTNDYVIWNQAKCACGQESPRLSFLGRTVDQAICDGRTIFAKDLEEEILAFPVSDEYFCYMEEDSGRRTVRIAVEPSPGNDVPCGLLRDAAAEIFHANISIDVHQPGSLPRDCVKPRRLVGFPKPTSPN